MVVYKCKICGGTLSPNPDGQTGKCEYCKSTLTLPKDKDEKLQNILNRANDFRMFCDFDRAIYEYEKALEIAEDEPEAHWGLMLSRYGVEYVKDPQSFTFKPTLHRISSISVMEDPDFLAAVKYAVPGNAYTYRNEAQVIETTMRRLLQLSASEDPYDIFISYKKEENGVRTADSYFAHDLYNKLTGVGYKVFFAQETLKQAAGEEFEPKIYAAIISAKVMIVIGTKEEYFNAVWVKNEWSRFSELIEHGEDKTIIPVFDGFNASKLPNRLSKYQALQKSDLDFLNVLMQTIEKRVDSRKSKITFDIGTRTGNVALEGGYLALEDGQFSNAEVFFEKALDANPHSSEAYFGKLMVELRARKQEDILLTDKPLNTYSNFEKAVRFADQQQKISLLQYEENIRQTIAKKEQERIKGEQERIERDRQIKDKIEHQVDAIAKAIQNRGLQNGGMSLQEQLSKEEGDYSSLQALSQSFDNKLAELQGLRSQKQRLNEKINQLKSRRQSLGLFARKEKAQIDSEIDQAEANISSLEQRIASKSSELRGFTSKQSVDDKLQEIADKVTVLETKVEENMNSDNIELSYIDAIKLYTRDADVKAWFNTKYYNMVSSMTIKFGQYPTAADGAKEPIEWEILDIQGDKFLLISKYALDCKKYDNTQNIVEWETCTLRNWLNNEFLSTAFSSEEQAKIQTTVVSSDESSKYGTKTRRNTQDKIFLLSISEADKFLSYDKRRQCKGTDYCYIQGAVEDYNGACFWWLRTSGYGGSHFACLVGRNGYVDKCGKYVDKSYGIRPALWVNL